MAFGNNPTIPENGATILKRPHTILKRRAAISGIGAAMFKRGAMISKSGVGISKSGAKKRHQRVLRWKRRLVQANEFAASENGPDIRRTPRLRRQ